MIDALTLYTKPRPRRREISRNKKRADRRGNELPAHACTTHTDVAARRPIALCKSRIDGIAHSRVHLSRGALLMPPPLCSLSVRLALPIVRFRAKSPGKEPWRSSSSSSSGFTHRCAFLTLSVRFAIRGCIILPIFDKSPNFRSGL